MNGHAERLVSAARRDVFDRVIVLEDVSAADDIIRLVLS
ncbi:MAG: hypothetical protein ACJAYU_003066 [Bradymonadia bacterium]|jgi:hypothetical protein